MSFPGSENDPDVHVITRDAPEQYHKNEPLDTPTFLLSLDLPASENGDMFAGLGPDGGHGGIPEFGLSPNFGSFSEYPESGEKADVTQDIGSTGNIESIGGTPNTVPVIGGNNSMNGALTKLSSLPPLPQLLDPVINNLLIPSQSVLSSYLQNGGVGGVSRAGQPLLTSAKKKKAPAVSRQPPAFIQKMWLMVNDPENNHYIRWSKDGESFYVAHREEFMKTILPKYFKHNNFASFVRQLNMYGWHKVQDVTSGLLRDDRNPEEVLQFKNALFLRGREDLLESIVRNRTATAEPEIPDNNLNLQLVINELELIKMNQLAIIEDMRRMRKDNQMLWNESFSARERHTKQTETLEKIMKFLAAVYGNSAGKVFEVEDRFDQHFNSQVSPYSNSKSNGTSNTNSAPNYPPQPFHKPRLMLMNKAYQQSTPEENQPRSLSTNANSGRITSLDTSAAQTPSDTNSPLTNGDNIVDGDTKKTPSARKGSTASLGKDAIEEIARNSPDLSQSDANKVFQQIMNQDGSAQSPNQYLSDFAQYFNGNSAAPSPKLLINENFQGLEQNIYRQGQALLHVQDLIQQLTDRQNEQQEQLQQHKNSISLASGAADEFDVDQFLAGNSNSLTTDGKSPAEDSAKRHIEEVDDEPKAKRRR